MDSRTFSFGIWNSTLGIRNSAQESGILQQLESVIQVQLTRNPESSIWRPESTAWNPGLKTSLDYLIWGELQNIHHETRSAPHMRLTELTKSVHSLVPNHSLLKEENGLANPSNLNSNMLLLARQSTSVHSLDKFKAVVLPVIKSLL